EFRRVLFRSLPSWLLVKAWASLHQSSPVQLFRVHSSVTNCHRCPIPPTWRQPWATSSSLPTFATCCGTPSRHYSSVRSSSGSSEFRSHRTPRLTPATWKHSWADSTSSLLFSHGSCWCRYLLFL